MAVTRLILLGPVLQTLNCEQNWKQLHYSVNFVQNEFEHGDDLKKENRRIVVLYYC
jgi:hypothetical protein